MTGTEGEPTGAQPGGEVPSAEDAAAASHPKGSMRFQDASTTAREPTVGEIRAREKAQEKAKATAPRRRSPRSRRRRPSASANDC